MANQLKYLGKRLKELMDERKMTQSALAEKAGIRQPHISSYINGHGLPSLENLIALASALNVSTGALTGEQESPPISFAIREPTEEELLLDQVGRHKIDPKRKAICLLALTAEPEDIDFIHDTALAPYIEGMKSGTPNHKKPAVR